MVVFFVDHIYDNKLLGCFENKKYNWKGNHKKNERQGFGWMLPR